MYFHIIKLSSLSRWLIFKRPFLAQFITTIYMRHPIVSDCSPITANLEKRRFKNAILDNDIIVPE